MQNKLTDKDFIMPCRDYYDDNPGAYYAETIKGLQKQVSFAESALCLTLNTLEQLLAGIKKDFDSNSKTNPLDILEFEEAGIARKELEQWWKKHKELDEKHRAEEAAKAEAKKRKAEEAQQKLELRKSALKKLTAEEKKALGIK